MHPSQSMNTQSGTVDLNELERREKAYEAQRQNSAQYRQAQYARIAAPNTYLPLESYPEYAARVAAPAATLSLGEMAEQAAAAARAREEAARLGARPGAAQASAKDLNVRTTFTRTEVLTVVSVERTRWFDDGTDTGGIRYRAAMQALDEIQRIFDRMI